MMKKTILKGLALGCIAVVLACNGNKGKGAESSANSTEDAAIMNTGDMLRLDSIGLELEDSIAEIHYTVFWPVSDKSVLADSIRRFIAKTVGDETADLTDAKAFLAKRMQAKYKELKDEYAEMSSEVEFEVPTMEYDCNITREYETDQYITLATLIYEYHGGAHGGALGISSTFSKADGRRMGYNLLKNTDSEGFRKLIKEGLYEYFSSNDVEIKNDEQLLDMLTIEGGIDQLPLPFYDPWLTSEGFVFCYQQYEIAPYAMGMPAFTVSYEKILPYLTDEAKSLLKL